MRLLLIATLSLFAAAPIAAQPAPGAGTYRSPAGFVLELPAGWVRAPDAALEQVRNATPTPPGLTYEAVFQAGPARWPSPPFAALAFGETPSWLTPEEFRRRSTAASAQAQLQRRATRADTLATGRVGLQVGEPWWDEANRAMWMRIGVQATGGAAWTVSMLNPTGRGMIILTYYGAAGADEEQVLAQLDSVIRSVRAD
jgi:hypothetical protein